MLRSVFSRQLYVEYRGYGESEGNAALGAMLSDVKSVSAALTASEVPPEDIIGAKCCLLLFKFANHSAYSV